MRDAAVALDAAIRSDASAQALDAGLDAQQGVDARTSHDTGVEAAVDPSDAGPDTSAEPEASQSDATQADAELPDATNGCGNDDCCAPETYRCNVTTKNVDYCGQGRRWQEVSECSSTQICRPGPGQAAACVLNHPYDVGNVDASRENGWSDFFPVVDTIYAVPITAPSRPTNYASFRVFGTAPTGYCRMALYNDASGRPGTRLATSNLTPVINGQGGSIPNVTVALVPGAQYWVAAACGDADQVPLLKKAGASYKHFEYLSRDMFTWGESLPQQFPASAIEVAGTGLSILGRVTDIP